MPTRDSSLEGKMDACDAVKRASRHRTLTCGRVVRFFWLMYSTVPDATMTS